MNPYQSPQPIEPKLERRPRRTWREWFATDVIPVFAIGLLSIGFVPLVIYVFTGRDPGPLAAMLAYLAMQAMLYWVCRVLWRKQG